VLAGAEAGVAQRPTVAVEERRRIDERLAAAFAQVDPRTDLLVAWLDELREHAHAPVGALARELGVPAPRLRSALARARAHRRRYLSAKNALVEHNLRLVVHIAKDFRGLESARQNAALS